MNDIVKSMLKFFGVFSIIFFVILFVLIEIDVDKEIRIGKVDAIFRGHNDNAKIAVVDGEEVYVKTYPKIGSEFKFTRYTTGILRISWNSSY